MVSSGCVTANFTKPTASFKSSVDTASSAIGVYFTELNSFERDLYLDEAVYDPTVRIEMKDASGSPTPLVGQYFKAASIKARMDALALLGSYANRLAELAGSTAPQEFSSATLALGTNLMKLDATFQELAGTSDSTAKDYIGPVSQIIGVVGEFYLERKRDAVITDAVERGAPAVTQILDLLQSDLEDVVAPLRKSGVQMRLAIYVNAYNNTTDTNGKVVDARAERAAMTISQRKERIETIRSAAEQYDQLVTFAPTEALNGIREAHAALVKYARSDKDPQSFAQLMTAIEALQAKAERVAAAVQQIRDIKRP